MPNPHGLPSLSVGLPLVSARLEPPGLWQTKPRGSSTPSFSLRCVYSWTLTSAIISLLKSNMLSMGAQCAMAANSSLLGSVCSLLIVWVALSSLGDSPFQWTLRSYLMLTPI